MWRGAALLLLCLLTFVVGVGRTAIVDADEAFYAGAGREMIADGDWLTPHYNFDVRLNKPILFYWLVAGTDRVLGVTETAARLWAALSGVGLAFVAYGVGRRWTNAGTGLLAGAIVATSTGVAVLVRQALPDMPLALFVSLTIWGAIEAASMRPITGRTTGRRRGEWSRRTWLIVASVTMGLGMLTKGPIAVALPAVALGPFLVWERYARSAGTSRPDFPLRMRDLLIAAGVFVLIAAPWYVSVTRVHGPSFLKEFFVGENFDRFATGKFNDRREPWFYVGVMAGGLLPWTAFGLLWLRPVKALLARQRPLTPVGARIGAWAVGPLLLLSASAGSQPRYILPVLVPVSILLARSIRQSIASGEGRLVGPHESRDWLFTCATAIAGTTLILFGALVLRARPLLLAVNAAWTPTGAFIMIGGGLATLAAALLMPRRLVPVILTVSAAATVMAFDATVLRAARPEPVEIVAAAIRRRGPVDDVCACGAFARNLTVYTHTKVTVGAGETALREFLQRPGVVLAVADSKRLAIVEASLGRRFQRVADVSYLNPDLWKKPGAALLNPDPDQYLQHVVLVSNR